MDPTSFECRDSESRAWESEGEYDRGCDFVVKTLRRGLGM